MKAVGPGTGVREIEAGRVPAAGRVQPTAEHGSSLRASQADQPERLMIAGFTRSELPSRVPRGTSRCSPDGGASQVGGVGKGWHDSRPAMQITSSAGDQGRRDHAAHADLPMSASVALSAPSLPAPAPTGAALLAKPTSNSTDCSYVPACLSLRSEGARQRHRSSASVLPSNAPAAISLLLAAFPPQSSSTSASTETQLASVGRIRPLCEQGPSGPSSACLLAREACIQDGFSAREACIHDGFSAREACIHDGCSAREACIQDGCSAREACIQDNLSPREACISGETSRLACALQGARACLPVLPKAVQAVRRTAQRPACLPVLPCGGCWRSQPACAQPACLCPGEVLRTSEGYAQEGHAVSRMGAPRRGARHLVWVCAPAGRVPFGVHPEVHLRGVGGGQANVGAMRSMPSSGSSVRRGRDSAPVCEDLQLPVPSRVSAAVVIVPATETLASGRAELARTGSSIAAPCGGLPACAPNRGAPFRVSAATPSHCEGVRSGRDLRSPSARQACIQGGRFPAREACIRARHVTCGTATPSLPHRSPAGACEPTNLCTRSVHRGAASTADARLGMRSVHHPTDHEPPTRMCPRVPSRAPSWGIRVAGARASLPSKTNVCERPVRPYGVHWAPAAHLFPPYARPRWARMHGQHTSGRLAVPPITPQSGEGQVPLRGTGSSRTHREWRTAQFRSRPASTAGRDKQIKDAPSVACLCTRAREDVAMRSSCQPWKRTREDADHAPSLGALQPACVAPSQASTLELNNKES